jgi:hypothetical protein
MTDTSKTIIILKTPEDWDAWIQTIKTAAMKKRIWDYINPDLPRTNNPATMLVITQTVQTLLEPVRPTHITVKPTANAYSDLSEDEKYYLRILNDDYTRLIKSYDEKEKAIGEIREVIQEHIKKDLH